MTEFKQIIGRGTRLRKDKGKWHLEILDFRNATAKFKTRHLMATQNRPKEVEKSLNLIKSLTPQSPLYQSLVRNIS